MEILTLIIIILRMHGGFGRTAPTSRELAIDALLEDLKSIRIEIVDEWMKIHDTAMVLVNNNTDTILSFISEDLRKEWPFCYKIAFTETIKEMTLILQNDMPKLCLVKIEELQNELMSLLGKASKFSTTDIADIRQCAVNPDYCQYNPKLMEIQYGIDRLRYLMGIHSNWTEQWDDAEQCYTDASSKIRSTLSSLRPPHENCNWFVSYKQFLQGLSLWPLTITSLLDPNKTSDSLTHEIDTPPPVYSLDIQKHIQSLINNWDQEKLRIHRFRTNLESNICNITSHYLKYINQRASYVNLYAVDSNKTSYKHCSGDIIKIQILRLDTFYKEDLHNTCFDKINDVAAHLYGMELHLSKFINQLSNASSCWQSSICIDTQFKLTDVQIILDAWENFDLTETWNFAKTCYSVATNTVWENIWKHRSALINCSTVNFSLNVFRHLPVNHIRYPNYELK